MIVNLTRNARLLPSVKVASNPWQRMKGLLGAQRFASRRGAGHNALPVHPHVFYEIPH